MIPFELHPGFARAITAQFQIGQTGLPGFPALGIADFRQFEALRIRHLFQTDFFRHGACFGNDPGSPLSRGAKVKLCPHGGTL